MQITMDLISAINTYSQSKTDKGSRHDSPVKISIFVHDETDIDMKRKKRERKKFFQF
jgi:hypothetical protein